MVFAVDFFVLVFVDFFAVDPVGFVVFFGGVVLFGGDTDAGQCRSAGRRSATGRRRHPCRGR
uniref:Uncharacterized protein n=1 Tax=Janibacter limosus TaxID=53458 RepID=A0AC61U456_9MICO|nr:hypothetical protein [Janibacter limosus]